MTSELIGWSVPIGNECYIVNKDASFEQPDFLMSSSRENPSSIQIDDKTVLISGLQTFITSHIDVIFSVLNFLVLLAGGTVNLQNGIMSTEIIDLVQKRSKVGPAFPNANISKEHCLVKHKYNGNTDMILIDGGLESNNPASYTYGLTNKIWSSKTLPLNRIRTEFDCSIVNNILLVVGGTNDGETETLDLDKSDEWVKGNVVNC